MDGAAQERREQVRTVIYEHARETFLAGLTLEQAYELDDAAVIERAAQATGMIATTAHERRFIERLVYYEAGELAIATRGLRSTKAKLALLTNEC